MTHPTLRVLRALGFVAATAIAGLTACSDGAALFLSDGVKLPAGSTCNVVESDVANLPVLSRGVLDLALSNQYRLLVRYRNRSGGDLSLRTAALRLDLGEFTPTTTPPKGMPKDTAANLALGFKYTTEGLQIPVSGGVLPNEWGVVEIPILDEEIGNLLTVKMQRFVDMYGQGSAPTVTVVAFLTVEGKVSGGDTERSNEFTFPVELCWGCLMAADPEVLPAACRPGQDDRVDQATCPFVARMPGVCPTYQPNLSEVQENDVPAADASEH